MDSDHFNSSDIEFEAPPNPLANAGKASIKQIIDHASEDRKRIINHASDDHKRSQRDKSADESAGSSCGEGNSGKKQKRNSGRGLKPAEFSIALDEELDEKPFDPVAVDKSDIEEQLRSGSSILLLERTPTDRSHCRALVCFNRELTGIPNIRSDFRLNLMDLTGNRSGQMSWWRQQNRYYHVTCIEHILDLTTLLEQNQIRMEGGIFMLGRAVCGTSRFHPMIEDWFTNSGRSFDDEEYGKWDKAYNDWKQESNTRDNHHHFGGCREGKCTCEPIPEKPAESDYFSAERTPRLLSEALASVVKINRLHKAFQDRAQKESLDKNRHDHPAGPSQPGTTVSSSLQGSVKREPPAPKSPPTA